MDKINVRHVCSWMFPKRIILVNMSLYSKEMLQPCWESIITNEKKYSRMGQVKFVEDSI